MIIDNFEHFNIIDKSIVSDGMGGYEETFVVGAEILGYMSKDTSVEMRIAEQQGAKTLYTFTTTLNVPIAYNMILLRQEDKQYFRLTNKPEKPPTISQIEFWKASAELFELPKE